MNLPLLLALVTFFGWGTGDLFTIIASRKIGATLTTFWVFFFSSSLSLLLIPFAPHDLSLITLPLLIFNIFLGILYVSGNVLISEAFRISSAPLVGIIIQAFPAVVLVLSALIFRDIITITQALFIIIIFLGVFLCSVDFEKVRKAEKIIDKGVLLAIIAMVFLSFYFTFSRILINSFGWFLPNFIATVCFPIIFLFMKKRKEKFYMPKEIKILFATFMVGLLIRSGDFALNYGLSLPNASSLVAPIAGAAPILFVIMSYLIFKDKLTRQQVFGIVTTLMGILLLTSVGQGN
ncbi:DMT family transporter [Candidatus Shapirobacteria bacterium]|nr:DMT family transporter [Candidatus Shapirobacteria bacterium]